MNINKISKINRRIIKNISGIKMMIRDLFFDYRNLVQKTFNTAILLDIERIKINGIDRNIARYLSMRYCEHRFDLLGSGWVKNSYDSIALGLEGNRYSLNLTIDDYDRHGEWLKQVIRANHLEKSKKIWEMVSDDYNPIDWQKDFKSGYRWSAKRWYKFQKICPKPGVDIKVPWELSRMQHLTQMGIFAKCLPELRNTLLSEFKNQVLDFLATNPYGMGVNWTCAMDVAIRAANLLIAFDLFRQQDTDGILNETFQAIFIDAIYHHGKHIINNLEWYEGKRGNHYLCDITGLLFISVYLTRMPEIDCWLAFALQELISEVDHQFHPDGGNFESSTGYHILSGEMVIYSTALVLGLSEEKRCAIRNYNCENWKKIPRLKKIEKQSWYSSDAFLPDNFEERLYRIVDFAVGLTKQNGEIPQIGDTDSGRFLRLSPSGSLLTTSEAIARYKNLSEYSKGYPVQEEYWDENNIESRFFIAAGSGLFKDGNEMGKVLFPLEFSFTSALTKGNTINRCLSDLTVNLIPDGLANKKKENVYKFHQQKVFPVTMMDGCKLTDNLRHYFFADSGMYVFKSDRIYLVCIGTPSGGHAHNDKLSIELTIDGRNIVVDPGTYLYTPLPGRRNSFRRTVAHCTMVVEGIEQNVIKSGIKHLFSMKNESRCLLMDCGERYIVLQLQYKNVSQVRRIEIFSDKITIDDYSNVNFLRQFKMPFEYSNGYGKLIVTSESDDKKAV